MATAEQLAEYRTAVNGISALAYRDLDALLRSMDLSNPASVRDALLEYMPELLGPYMETTGELAGAFYETLRSEVMSGVFYADATTTVDPDKVDALVRYSVSPLFGQSNSTVLTLLGGGTQRIIAGAGRATIGANASTDRVRVGIQRVPAPGCCAFCAMLASRGAAYNSIEAAGGVVGRGVDASTTRGKVGGQGQGVKVRGTRKLGASKYHDFCRCVAAPVFAGDTWSTELADTYLQRYTGFGEGEPSKELLAQVRGDAGIK